jgi:nucleotide-binding universal stress UspA family protein
MAIYRHLLFAADYDALQEPGLLAKVCRVREAFGCRASLVHVVDSRGLHSGLGAPVLIPHQRDDIPAEASTNITTTAALVPHEDDALLEGARGFLDRVAADLGIAVADCHALEHDSVRDAIIDTAGKIGADLIVMGHGSRHWLSWFTASTAQGVLGRAPCDVLVIHLRE